MRALAPMAMTFFLEINCLNFHEDRIISLGDIKLFVTSYDLELDMVVSLIM